MAVERVAAAVAPVVDAGDGAAAASRHQSLPSPHSKEFPWLQQISTYTTKQQTDKASTCHTTGPSARAAASPRGCREAEPLS